MKESKTWIIAYINRDFMDIANEELSRYESFKDVEAYIPTIRLLKKKSKGKNVFEILPLLFNYGFFKMPYEQATNTDFLMEMRHRISCIYAWVKDPIATMSSRPSMNMDNRSDRVAIPAAAVATDEEVTRMIKTCDMMSIYDKSDIKRIEVGSYIILEGYPFDGIEAKILDIDTKKKEVKVELQLESLFKEVRVSFENVFYTVYRGFENKTREKLLDDMGDINMIDSLTFKNRNYHE